MKSLFTISMLFLVLFAGHFAFAGPCEEAKHLRNERIEFDISMRKKRIAVRQSIIDFKIRDNEYEKKLIEIHEKIIKAKEGDVDALWKQYDAVSAERDALSAKADLANDAYSELSLERAREKMDLKHRQMIKRYECVLDGELGAKLGAVTKNTAVMERLSGDDAAKFRALVKQREDELKNLQADYEKYLQAMDLATKQYEFVNERIAQYARDEEALYGERDQSYDNAYNLSSNFSDEVGRVSGKLDDISTEILKSPVLINR